MKSAADIKKDLVSDGSVLKGELTSASYDYVSTIKDDGSELLSALDAGMKSHYRVFYDWWQLVMTLKRTVEEAAKMDLDSHVDYGIPVIDAEMTIRSAFDYAGHAMKCGITCPVCGKKVENVNFAGFCSTECVITYIKDTVLSYLLPPSEKYKEFELIIQELSNILSQTTLVLNAIVGLPTIIKELDFITDITIRDYMKAKLNEGFCYLYQCMMILTIKKNKFLERMYIPIIWGYVAAPLMYALAGMEYIEKGIKVAEDAFNTAYSAVMNALEGLKVTGLCIPPESFTLVCTPRSFMSPFPLTNPDANKVFIEVPGALGTNSNLLSTFTAPLDNIDIQKIETFLQKIMVPLTPVDYFLEPELFKARYALSDQAKIMLNLRQQLEFICVGKDYLPKFENMLPMRQKTVMVGGEEISLPVLNTGYLWFLLGLMDSWAPHSMALVGSYQNPAV